MYCADSLDTSFDQSTGNWTLRQKTIGSFETENIVCKPSNLSSINSNTTKTSNTVWKLTYFKHYTGAWWYAAYDIYTSRQVDGYEKGTFIENVSSTNENAYPANGAQEENGTMYYYVKK